MKPGDPILFLGKKGPLDWVAHRADAVTPEGLAASKCADKGARRAVSVAPGSERSVTWCPSCWTANEIEHRRG